MNYRYLDTFFGPLLVAGEAGVLRAIRFPREGRHAPPQTGWRADSGGLGAVVEQLEEYFAGERRTFDLELGPMGTEFQLAVWRQLERIPYGETLSYGELARRLGKPTAFRAVGAANGANPLPIVVPCHRVIGANGHLVGFGGGLELKRRLLDHERGGSLFP